MSGRPCLVPGLPTQPAPDNPTPVVHHMIGTATEGYGADYFALAPHGYATSHIDALCHIFHRGKIYNGYGAETVTAHGATKLGSITSDPESSLGGSWSTCPLSGVSRRWSRESPSSPRTWSRRRGQQASPCRPETPYWCGQDAGSGGRPTAPGSDGWHGRPGRLLSPWLHDREVAVLGSDGVSDVLPSRVDPSSCRSTPWPSWRWASISWTISISTSCPWHAPPQDDGASF